MTQTTEQTRRIRPAFVGVLEHALRWLMRAAIEYDCGVRPTAAVRRAPAFWLLALSLWGAGPVPTRADAAPPDGVDARAAQDYPNKQTAELFALWTGIIERAELSDVMRITSAIDAAFDRETVKLRAEDGTMSDDFRISGKVERGYLAGTSVFYSGPVVRHPGTRARLLLSGLPSKICVRQEMLERYFRRPADEVIRVTDGYEVTLYWKTIKPRAVVLSSIELNSGETMKSSECADTLDIQQTNR